MFKSSASRNRQWSIILLLILAAIPCFAQLNKDNIALGCAVTFNRAPNYTYSTDENDIRQLTDGQYANGWVDKAMVGWVQDLRVSITIDLGTKQAIGGISFSTAAGSGGVQWPAAIQIFTSDDAKNWYYVTDLVKTNTPPLSTVRQAFRYISNDLSTNGRYLRVTITPSGVFVFCDEIEVYRGNEQMINKPRGEIIDATSLDRLTLNAAFLQRLKIDKDTAAGAIRNSAMSANAKAQLLRQLDADFTEAVKTAPDPGNFKAILPFNDAHARILGMNSIALQKRKLPQLFAWKKHRFDPVTMNELPVKLTSPKISINMLKNEVRSDAFLLSNTGDQPVKALIVLRNMTGGANPDWLQLSLVPWVDNTRFIPIADALPDTPFTNGCQINLPAGMTQLVWVTVDSTKLTPGSDNGEIAVLSDAPTIHIPFSIRVSKVLMPKPRLSLAMWDYTDRDSFGGITLQNRDAAIALMRSHGVDSPWATKNVLPWPTNAEFSAENTLMAPLSFTQFDTWVQRWPGARQYTVFCNVGNVFADAKLGTVEFNARVGAWARALAQHMTAIGLSPRQLWLSLVDEPNTEEKNALITAWARAIRAAAPELTIFVNPIWKHPDLVKDQSMFDSVDILCPNILQLLSSTEAAMQFYEQRQRAGQKLWFFNSGGSVRRYDPHRYYRLMSWFAFRHHASGIAFWAFGDNGSSKNSWDEYLNERYNFSPVFLDPTSVTDSIHWQAVREGIEDYETLSLLREAAATTTSVKLLQQTAALFATIDAVLGDKTSQMELTWDNADDRTQPDDIRIKAISLLEKMR